MQLAAPLYREVISFIPKALFLEDFLYGKFDGPVLPSLQALVARARERWLATPQDDPLAASVAETIRGHLDGVLIGPAMVALARGGVLARLEQGPMETRTLAGNQASLHCLFDLLATQDWLVRERDSVRLTSRGLYAAQIATSYGVTVSYLPMFNALPTLLFGNARGPRVDESGVELLVNRGMNVWGSGGAHKTYFKKVDEIIIEIFNRPLARQPQGICDMGCGDGTFLEHLYEVVKQKTARGKVLEQHPLVLVGADFNKVARRVAKQHLRKAGVPVCHVIAGDINRPAQLGSDLEALGLDVHDLLHVRSFLDHNRPYSPPANYVQRQPAREIYRRVCLSGRRNSCGRAGRKSGAIFATLGALRWPLRAAGAGAAHFAAGTRRCESAPDAGGGLRRHARIFRSIFGGAADFSGMRAGSGTAGGRPLPREVPCFGTRDGQREFLYGAGRRVWPGIGYEHRRFSRVNFKSIPRIFETFCRKGLPSRRGISYTACQRQVFRVENMRLASIKMGVLRTSWTRADRHGADRAKCVSGSSRAS